MKTCTWCGEKILASESNVFYPNCHRECAIRQACGSVAHLEKRCGCYVEDSEEGDPPGMSKREAAFAAMQLLQAQEREREEAAT